MPPQTSKIIITQFYERLWNTWGKPFAPEILSADFRFRGSLGVETQGTGAIFGYMDRVKLAFPDFHNTVEEVVC